MQKRKNKIKKKKMYKEELGGKKKSERLTDNYILFLKQQPLNPAKY